MVNPTVYLRLSVPGSTYTVDLKGETDTPFWMTAAAYDAAAKIERWVKTNAATLAK